MAMRVELILAGALLLSVALTVKAVWDWRPLPRLALSLNLLLAALAGFHLWPVVHGLAAAPGLLWSGFPVDAAAYWVGLLAAVLPGWLLSRHTLRDAEVEFPPFVDRLSGVLCTVLLIWLLSGLILMTAALVPGSAGVPLSNRGGVRHWQHVMVRTPVEFYLRTAAACGGDSRSELRSTRLPIALRRQLTAAAMPR